MGAGEAFSFTSQQRLDVAAREFEHQTGLAASVYVGDTGDDLGAFTDAAVAELPVASGLVLLVVDPGRRQMAIRTTGSAVERISDESCALATLSMTTSFGAGDLAGGIIIGLRMLGDATAPARLELGRPEPTSSTVTRR